MSAPTLGERLARAYGWTPTRWYWRAANAMHWRAKDGGYHPTPDPVHNGEHFMAMLQSFEDTGPDLMDIVRDSGSTTSTLAEWRAEVIEGILEVVET